MILIELFLILFANSYTVDLQSKTLHEGDNLSIIEVCENTGTVFWMNRQRDHILLKAFTNDQIKTIATLGSETQFIFRNSDDITMSVTEQFIYLNNQSVHFNQLLQVDRKTGSLNLISKTNELRYGFLHFISDSLALNISTNPPSSSDTFLITWYRFDGNQFEFIKATHSYQNKPDLSIMAKNPVVKKGAKITTSGNLSVIGFRYSSIIIGTSLTSSNIIYSYGEEEVLFPNTIPVQNASGEITFPEPDILNTRVYTLDISISGERIYRLYYSESVSMGYLASLAQRGWRGSLNEMVSRSPHVEILDRNGQRTGNKKLPGEATAIGVSGNSLFYIAARSKCLIMIEKNLN